jgi:hypothetical protein
MAQLYNKLADGFQSLQRIVPILENLKNGTGMLRENVYPGTAVPLTMAIVSGLT